MITRLIQVGLTNPVNELGLDLPVSQMEKLAANLLNDKVWWHKTLYWRNIAAQCSVYYTFMLEGVFIGVWSYFLVDIQLRVKLSDSELGTSVLFVYLAMVLVSPFTAFMLKTYGSQASMFIGAITYGISLSCLPLATSYYMLTFAMLIFGWTMGIMDISMNSCAILTEIVAGKSLFGGFHGSYSIAAAIGSIVGEALSTNHFDIEAVFLSFSVGSTLLTVLLHGNMYNYRQEVLITEFNHAASENQIPVQPTATAIGNNDIESDVLHKRSSSGVLLVSPEEPLPVDSSEVIQYNSSPYTIAFYSMVGFLASFGESSIVTWSIVYFDREMHASLLYKSMGFICFMVCMALGRFSCDVLRSTFGRRIMVRVGGIFAFSGLCLVALSPDLPCSMILGCIGFSITGMGLSTLIPTMFSSAGHIPGGAHAGTSIAIVSMFTNSGAIVSSPLIGMLSDGLGSMRLAFLCDALLLGIICPLSWGIPAESMMFKQAAAAATKNE